MAKIVPFGMSPPKALAIIREVAQDTSRLYYSAHARKRMRQRHITPIQVVRALRSGKLVEGPAQAIGGNWECVVEYVSAGQPIRVVLAIELVDPASYVTVITVKVIG
jgi:hypothetical protein